MLTALVPPEEPRTRGPARVWLIPAATVLAVAVNAGAAIVGSPGSEGGATTLVDPAGYAFGIWGVIFAANLVFAGYQALPGQRDDALLNRVATPYVAGQAFATIFAVASLVDSHPLAQASTVLYFGAAVATYGVLGVGRRDDGWARHLCAWLPASLSMAWLLAASVVVLADVLVSGVDASPPFGTGAEWAAGAIVFQALIAAALLVWRRDLAFAAVTGWALIAIGQAQGNQVVDTAVVASLAAVGLTAIGMVPAAAAGLGWRAGSGRRARGPTGLTRPATHPEDGAP